MKTLPVLLLLWGLAAVGTVHGAGAAQLAAPDVEQDQQAARQSVEGFHNALLAAAQSGQGYAARLALLQPAVASHFNVPTIARLSLGRTWRGLDAGQQSEFQGALSELVAATYADRFAQDSGHQFEIRSVANGRRGPVVRSALIRQNGEPVALDYHFRDGKIYNVVADGVSDLSLRRADYNSVIKQQGYDALLAHIDRQTQARAGTATTVPEKITEDAKASTLRSADHSVDRKEP